MSRSTSACHPQNVTINKPILATFLAAQVPRINHQMKFETCLLVNFQDFLY